MEKAPSNPQRTTAVCMNAMNEKIHNKTNLRNTPLRHILEQPPGVR
jgi:hypothetical protein